MGIKPTVTVAILCYNYGRYITKAVNSIMTQTYSEIELIIINDGSTDETHDIVTGLIKEFPNIRYYKQKNNGVVYTRNRAIDLANGEYLIQLDADDYLQNNYVEAFVSMSLSNNADIVYGDYKMFGSGDELSDFPQYNFERLKNGNYINISSLIRTSALKDVRFDGALTGKTHEDWDFFLGLCASGYKAVKCSESLLYYRIHENGRNNRMTSIEDRQRYIDVYTYIINKYANLYPEEFSYLFGATYGGWFIDSFNKNIALEIENATLRLRNTELTRRNNNIYHSSSWRITRPLRYVGGLFKKYKSIK